MTTRFVSSLLLLASLSLPLSPAWAESAKVDANMSPPKAVPTESKKETHNDFEPDSLAQLNHEALSEFKEHKNDVAQHLLDKVVAGLEQEKNADLSLAEALENLHLVLAAQSKAKESDEALQHAREIRKKFHLPALSPKTVDILPTATVRQQSTEKAREIAEIAEGRDPLFPADKLTTKTLEAYLALMQSAQHEREIGENRKAIFNFRKALAIANTMPKPNDKVVAALNMLAGAYRLMDKPGTARIFYMECIALDEKMGKTETAEYATLLDNAGQTLVVLHEYNEAEKMLEQATQIFKKTKGVDSADLGMAMCNLGEVYLMLKQDQKGEQIIADALTLFRRSLSPEDMRVLITADNLAEVYGKHGKLKEAEELQRTIIATMEKVVGKGVHPDLVVALNNLAQTLFQEKKYTETDPLLKRCIEMNRAIYGDKHPKTIAAIRSYVTFLEKTGKKEEGDRILKQLTAPAAPEPAAGATAGTAPQQRATHGGDPTNPQ